VKKRVQYYREETDEAVVQRDVYAEGHEVKDYLLGAVKFGRQLLFTKLLFTLRKNVRVF